VGRELVLVFSREISLPPLNAVAALLLLPVAQSTLQSAAADGPPLFFFFFPLLTDLLYIVLRLWQRTE
jgi:hypothetical protein